MREGVLLSSCLQKLAFVGACATLALLTIAPSSRAAPFRNLDFEEGQLVPVSPQQPNRLVAALALPGWTLRVGEQQVSDIFYNQLSLGLPRISIWDEGGIQQGLIAPPQGQFYVVLERDDASGVPVSISQIGDIPTMAQSVLVQTSDYQDPPRLFLNGLRLPMVRVSPPNPLGNFDPATWGADISAFAATPNAELRFVSQDPFSYISNAFDDIRFSPTPIPEPTSGFAVAAACLALRCFRRNRKTGGFTPKGGRLEWETSKRSFFLVKC